MLQCLGVESRTSQTTAANPAVDASPLRGSVQVMPSRDYLLRLIEQVGMLLSRAVGQRKQNTPQEALQSVMAACERLFGMEAVQLFQFTPDQHVPMLADGETDESARDKILMYAALTAEAGRCYLTLSQPDLARGSFLTALRLTLKARTRFPSDALPEYAPRVPDLLAQLGEAPLDPNTAELLADFRSAGHVA